MTRLLMYMLVGAFLLVSVPSYGFEGKACTEDRGCKGECIKCHSLTTKEASRLLKAEKLKAKVLSVKPAQVKGLWAVEVERAGKRFVVYVDFAKKYLVEGRFTLLAELGRPILKKVDVASIPTEDAILLGRKDAETKIIIFDDPDCPYCKKLHGELKKIVKKRKDIAFLLKMYPLAIHPEAYDKSKAIVCKKSLKLLEDAFAGKKLPPPSCETTVIDDNIKLARKLGIEGTPAIIFPDGRLIPGYVDADTLLEVLEMK